MKLQSKVEPAAHDIEQKFLYWQSSTLTTGPLLLKWNEIVIQSIVVLFQQYCHYAFQSLTYFSTFYHCYDLESLLYNFVSLKLSKNKKSIVISCGTVTGSLQLLNYFSILFI